MADSRFPKLGPNALIQITLWLRIACKKAHEQGGEVFPVGLIWKESRAGTPAKLSSNTPAIATPSTRREFAMGRRVFWRSLSPLSHATPSAISKSFVSSKMGHGCFATPISRSMMVPRSG